MEVRDTNDSFQSRRKHLSIYRIGVEALVINEAKRYSRKIIAISYRKADGLPGLFRSRTSTHGRVVDMLLPNERGRSRYYRGYPATSARYHNYIGKSWVYAQ